MFETIVTLSTTCPNMIVGNTSTYAGPGESNNAAYFTHYGILFVTDLDGNVELYELTPAEVIDFVNGSKVFNFPASVNPDILDIEFIQVQSAQDFPIYPDDAVVYNPPDNKLYQRVDGFGGLIMFNLFDFIEIQISDLPALNKAEASAMSLCALSEKFHSDTFATISKLCGCDPCEGIPCDHKTLDILKTIILSADVYLFDGTVAPPIISEDLKERFRRNRELFFKHVNPRVS